ncbi:MAG: hypothetical protein AAF988_07515, partial [Pseudomonadota bacterium]
RVRLNTTAPLENIWERIKRAARAFVAEEPKNKDPLSQALQDIENIKRKLENAVEEISGVKIEIKNLRPADKPRVEGEVHIRFEIKQGARADAPEVLTNTFGGISTTDGTPRSVAGTGNGYTTQLAINYNKLGL